MIHRIALAFVLLPILATCPAQAQTARDIDPFLGTEGGGNTFLGPSLPWAMIKPGPDIGDNNANSGWRPTGEINGFSQLHLSGAGGGAKYGNILIQPTTGAPQAFGFSSPRADERASVGFYGVTLTRYPIQVELTSARRTALYRFTYPANESRNILFDLAHILDPVQAYGEAQIVVRSAIHILSPTEVSGQHSVIGGWNKQIKPFTVYFYAVTDTPSTSFGTWHEKELTPASAEFIGGINQGSGAYLTFPSTGPRAISLKLGISYISEAQAKQNALSEISGFDFQGTHAAAIAAWDKALSTVSIQGATNEDRGTFATAIYHTMLQPVDRTGENPLWQSTEPYYDDFFTIWDTFRTSSPLFDIIAPEREDAIVRSLVDTFRHEGWLPDGRSGNVTGRTQGGSNPDMVIADAWLNHLPDIDWPTAYRAVLKDAEVSPADPTLEGRGDLAEWKTLGYLSVENSDRPGSRQVEYAANDYAIATLARGLNHPADYAKYLKRSANWENLWDKEGTDAGFSGFIWVKHKDGSWKSPFDPHLRGSWGGDNFYEGNTWTYSLYAPQNVARLIQLCGGTDTFIRRLDAFFDQPDHFDVNNEPGFLTPYLYSWAGRQDLTAARVRKILAASFHSGRLGLPGNDDSGAMSSWYLFSRMGFFPNAGQDVFLIGSPAYPSLTLRLANGRTFTIEAPNVSTANQYIARAEWNGKPWTRSWFTIADLNRGGRLVLTMSASPVNWFTGPPPPSPAAP
jgi:predicted alpha-1,2-mannosidase